MIEPARIVSLDLSLYHTFLFCSWSFRSFCVAQKEICQKISVQSHKSHKMVEMAGVVTVDASNGEQTHINQSIRIDLNMH